MQRDSLLPLPLQIMKDEMEWEYGHKRKMYLDLDIAIPMINSVVDACKVDPEEISKISQYHSCYLKQFSRKICAQNNKISTFFLKLSLKNP